VETHNALLGAKAVPGSIDEVEWPKPGSADLVIGGPPCQGFSVIGKMNPRDPRSRHVFRFLDFVEHVQPEAFVLENVKALGASDRWAHVRRRLTTRARKLGYKTQIVLLHAAEFGVPQRRERMFLIGCMNATPPAQIAAVLDSPITVREVLDTLPSFGARGNDTICTAGITPAKRPVLRPTAYKGSLLFNGNGRPLRLDSPAPTLPASMGGNATPILDQNELETGEESWIVAYHRQLLGPKPKIAAAVPDYLRRITVEEAAALQTFPADMQWMGTNSARYRQIGNAVPPLLGFHVAGAVADMLGIKTPERVLSAA
jgi:DNA (cytosine-5)-methyltransferase 1